VRFQGEPLWDILYGFRKLINRWRSISTASENTFVLGEVKLKCEMQIYFLEYLCCSKEDGCKLASHVSYLLNNNFDSVAKIIGLILYILCLK